ncbi:hypothetical protein BDZ90DRAFT_52700 [Jaminaea rosea]|uniref:Secreted protein n=1 Tax=Jaminaea rosea TaxID=1569628 RepID=A0A316UNJ3_9BASI|nr:hypothetical protein BDZ90DRAFT_52700 [Jaminaea rosea]PWN26348.1 hypothetical protein BDZ90DRAFT_52700 [Jaminaea rosea]
MTKAAAVATTTTMLSSQLLFLFCLVETYSLTAASQSATLNLPLKKLAAIGPHLCLFPALDAHPFASSKILPYFLFFLYHPPFAFMLRLVGPAFLPLHIVIPSRLSLSPCRADSGCGCSVS